MQARWRFRVVKKNGAGDYVTRDGKALEHVGTDEEALSIARRLAVKRTEAVRLEVISVGRPTEIGDTPGRLRLLVRERPDGRGWNLEGDGLGCTWYTTIKDAVSYGAFRTTGYLSETRILNKEGQVTHVILIDSQNGSEQRLFARDVFHDRQKG